MMENYEPLMSYGEDTAEIYDAEPDAGQREDTEASVSFLETLSGGGPALELAIGTGRVALPLAAGACASTASTSQPPWSPSYAPNRVVTRLQ
jgi:hypothetical protein